MGTACSFGRPAARGIGFEWNEGVIDCLIECLRGCVAGPLRRSALLCVSLRGCSTCKQPAQRDKQQHRQEQQTRLRGVAPGCVSPPSFFFL